MLFDHLLEQDPLGSVAADQKVHDERPVGAELPCAYIGDDSHHEVDAFPVDEAAADRHDYPLKGRNNNNSLRLLEMIIYIIFTVISLSKNF